MTRENFARALSDRAIRNAKPSERPYKLTDGGGLFLLVQPTGAKLWRYKFRMHGKEQVFAIGKYPDVALADARERHTEARKLVAANIHPTTQRQEERAKAAADAERAKAGTFQAMLDAWKAAPSRHRAAVTIAQRDREIAKYLTPELGKRRIETITRRDLAGILKKVSAHAPEVARNLRTHMNAVFEFAVDTGVTQGNPTPGPRSLPARKQTPHPALEMERIGALLSAVDASRCEPETKAALRLVLLTACRKVEATGARWDEFDLEAGGWTIPAARMKGRREHWVPLPRQAVALLRDLKATARSECVFPHRVREGEPMAGRTLNAVLERAGFQNETKVHGLRALFSTWANAQPGANPDVIERCLAHEQKDKVRAAYNRHQYRDERRALLQKWADAVDAAAGAMICREAE